MGVGKRKPADLVAWRVLFGVRYGAVWNQSVLIRAKHWLLIKKIIGDVLLILPENGVCRPGAESVPCYAIL